ncbi:MAG: fibronectin type III domain-containing protein, partial [Chitinophagales bacterium]
MKRLITLLLLCTGFIGVNAQTLYNVTFKVDMNEVAAAFTTPEVNGNFNGWCGGCAPMSDADADGIWEVTIALAAGTYEYKFAADGWAIQESLAEGSSCTITSFGFTNRLLVVSGDAVLDPVCWGSCSSCTDLITYDVTFNVNMNEVGEAFTTPEVNGSFNGWCGGCNAMSDVDGDGIWTATIALEPGTYEFKYAADGWAIQENLTPGSPCTMTTGPFTNRVITVSEDVVLDPVCWGSCDNCGETVLYNITFAVNMNDVTESFTTPEVNGSFNGWCGGCNPLSDMDGDGIWTATIALPAGFYEYKFAADGWSIQENLTPGDPCTMTTGVFTNRTLNVSADATLSTVCWGSCDNCPSGCSVPTGLMATDVTGTSATLSWDLVDGAIGYNIQIEDDALGNNKRKRVGPEVNSVNVGPAVLSPGNTYVFAVKALCDGENSDWSDAYYFSTPLRLAAGSENNISVYPNPSHGFITIDAGIFSDAGIIAVKNINGQ